MRFLSTHSHEALHRFRRTPSWTRVLAVLAVRRKGRHDLSRLDDHLLEDIGLTRAMAQSEASKQFWRD